MKTLSDHVMESIALVTMTKAETAVKQGERVPFIQDTTSVSYRHRSIEGMGYDCDFSQKGRNVHRCIATTESGIALGMIHQETQGETKK